MVRDQSLRPACLSLIASNHLTQLQRHKVDDDRSSRSKHMNMSRLMIGWIDDDPQAALAWG